MTKEYQEAQDTVSRPGKFEGCEAWAVLAYDDSQNGCWENASPPDSEWAGTYEGYTELDDATRERYQLGPEIVAVGLFEDSQGFVYETAFNQDDFNTYKTEVQAQAEQADAENDGD